MPEPDDHDRGGANLAVLVAVILLVGLAVWLLIAFKHSSDTLDCIASGRHNCVPIDGQ